jgi:2-keto-4-pentenoate hydratase/2-oxohepta-3-ene-1,7-dioic acid hydratase in catechol pathway
MKLLRAGERGAERPAVLDPDGVALRLPDHPYLRDGDRVRLEIDGLGHAEQRFVAAD